MMVASNHGSKKFHLRAVGTFFSENYKKLLEVALLVLILPVLFYVIYTPVVRWLYSSKAVTDTAPYEVEAAALSGNVQIKTGDQSASQGSYIEFGINQPSPASFQPTAPYYAAFYYAWYKAPTVSGENYSYWSDGHSPPNNWFSNYMPIVPGSYDPATKAINPRVALYSPRDKNAVYWQLQEMLNAKIEVAISSWWGQSTSATSDSAGVYATEGKSDYSFRQIIKNFMNASDNPYPNLRWTVYYEKEGFSNPSEAEIASDLNYLISNYVNEKAYLKINGQPVIFVYGDDADTSTGCAMATRWVNARDQVAQTTGKRFYVALKLFSGYKTCAKQPDSWHQYAPASYGQIHEPDAAFASPGFWKNGTSVTLPRDTDPSLPNFTGAVQRMVAANATWKQVQTWNEWGEGTSVEPGVQVRQQTGAGVTTYDPNGVPFERKYVEVLNRLLPNLEQGSGR